MIGDWDKDAVIRGSRFVVQHILVYGEHSFSNCTQILQSFFHIRLVSFYSGTNYPRLA
jgi:hypothetical protein